WLGFRTPRPLLRPALDREDHQRDEGGRKAALRDSDHPRAALLRPMKTGSPLHSARWNREGLLVKNRQVRFLSTVALNRQGGRRRLFLYTLRPGAELESNSTCTDCTGPTATPAEHLYRFSTEVV